MWCIVLFSLLTASSAQDSECTSEYSRLCSQRPLGFPENEAELDLYCPDAVKFFECQKDYQTGCNKDTKEVTSILEIVRELCRRDSALRQAIGSHLQCIRETFHHATCGQTAYLDTVNAYSNYQGEGSSDEIGGKTYCTIEAYAVACMGEEISRNCGSGAKEAIIEIMRRTDYVGSKIACTDSVRESIIQDLPQLQINEYYKDTIRQLLLKA